MSYSNHDTESRCSTGSGAQIGLKKISGGSPLAPGSPFLSWTQIEITFFSPSHGYCHLKHGVVGGGESMYFSLDMFGSYRCHLQHLHCNVWILEVGYQIGYATE